MDNEYVIIIGETEYHFRLKSQRIVMLEKMYGKNIFEIIQDLSFSSMADFISASLVSPEKMDKNALMDILLENYTLQELSEVIMVNIAVKSGLIKQSDVDSAMNEIENTKNQ